MIARALGFPDSEEGLPSSMVSLTLERTKALHVSPTSVHKPSMMLDAEKGQPIEVEVILGEVVRMAKARNVPVPVRPAPNYGLAFAHRCTAYRDALCAATGRTKPNIAHSFLAMKLLTTTSPLLLEFLQLRPLSFYYNLTHIVTWVSVRCMNKVY